MNEVKDISIKQKIDLFMANINPGWSTLEKAKYIYINLGKLYSFDNQYTYGSDETIQQILDRSKSLTSLDDDLVNQRHQICISLAKIYILLLKQIGINAREVPGEIYHISVEIENDDGEWVTADLQKDLPNIQTNSRTKYFASQIPSSKQLQIDEKIGYVNEQRRYTNEGIQEYIEEILDSLVDFYCFDVDEGFKNTISGIFEKMSEFLNLSNMTGENNQYMGFTEQKLYYTDLFRNILPGALKMYYVSESKMIMTIQKSDKSYLFLKNAGNSFTQMNEEESQETMRFIQAIETKKKLKKSDEKNKELLSLLN